MHLLTPPLQVVALEESLRAHRETLQKNVHGFRQKMGEMNKQLSELTDEKKKLETKVSSLEQEIHALKTTQPLPPDGAVVTTAQSDEIQKQKEIIVCDLFFSSYGALTSIQASLQSEREQLLAERSSWSKQTASMPEPANPKSENWEAEKAELVKSRDEALEKLKVKFFLSES